MTIEVFNTEIKRLMSVYGERHYPAERQKVIWRTFQNETDTVFIDATEFMIATYRSAPMMKEMHDAVNEARAVMKNRQREMSGDRSMIDILNQAYNPVLYSDEKTRERIKARIKLVGDYTSGRLTKKQFYQGCDFYDDVAGLPKEKEARWGIVPDEAFFKELSSMPSAITEQDKANKVKAAYELAREEKTKI